MAGSEMDKTVVEEFPGILTVYSDGSITRHPDRPLVPSSEVQPTPHAHAPVATSDIVLNPTTGLWARLSLPQCHAENAPLAIHFHGGGFCCGSPAWAAYTHFVGRMAVATRTVWASVAYRLAPEHRLPAALHDCIDSIFSLATSSNPWLTGFDRRRIFLVGDSAGCNLIYHATLHYADKDLRHQFKIMGLVMLHPGFVKEERSASEIDSPEMLALVDSKARMAVPPGEDKNYFVLNPSVPPAAEVRLPPCLVVVGGKDLFRDREFEFCEKMEEMGQMLEVVSYDQMGHCFIIGEEGENCAEAVDLVEKVVSFMERFGGLQNKG